MPAITRREPRRYGEGYPGAVVRLLGAYGPIHWGYQQGTIHLLGPPGPRGGRRALCGVNAHSNWIEAPCFLPPAPGWVGDRWRNACSVCKQTLGRGLANDA